MAYPLRANQTAAERTLASRLSVGALGVALVVLVSIAWGTGLLYLVVRIGLPSPVRLVFVDGVHIYVGLASIAFFAAKISRVGFHQQVSGVPELVLWQRWVSWGLLVLYSAVYGTGLLLLPPWPRVLREGLVNAHLLTSVWAAVLTTWHVWHHRSRALPYLPGAGRRLPHRFWVGMALVILPMAGILTSPPALSPLTQNGAGGAWTPAALRGIFLDRMAISPDGQTVVAGGVGLYASQLPGGGWRRIDFPSDLVLGLALPRGPVAAYVGTGEGLYASARIDGPYNRLPFPSWGVHAIAVDPDNPNTIWASSRDGFWRSRDGGVHWISESVGISYPREAWAITYFGGTVFASDAFAVYRWDGSVWVRSSDQGFVVSLDATPDDQRLFATSMGQGIRVFDGQRWKESDSGLAAKHGGVRAIHITSLSQAVGGRAFAATMLDGVAVSTDGGRSWAPLGAGLPTGSVWRVLPMGARLLAATDHGLYEYRLVETRSAGVGWWTILIAAALLTGTATVFWVALPKDWWRR